MLATRIRQTVWICPLLALCLTGCGTTRWTDTKRTATEQMLVSDAIDRAVSRIDFRLLAGKSVFLDTSYLGDTVDKEYLTSTLRQQMVCSGCVLKEKRDQATFIVEARAGSVGTDRHDLLYGIPAISLPTFSAPVGGTNLPSALPEVALARRTDQQAVAKIAVFAYHRETGAPVWQSGADIVASKARDLWVFGAGPFQRGNIYDRPQFAGDDFHVPLVSDDDDPANKLRPVRVSQERLFKSPKSFPEKTVLVLPHINTSLRLLGSPFAPDAKSKPASFDKPLSVNPPWEPLLLPAPRRRFRNSHGGEPRRGNFAARLFRGPGQFRVGAVSRRSAASVWPANESRRKGVGSRSGVDFAMKSVRATRRAGENRLPTPGKPRRTVLIYLAVLGFEWVKRKSSGVSPRMVSVAVFRRREGCQQAGLPVWSDGGL